MVSFIGKRFYASFIKTKSHGGIVHIIGIAGGSGSGKTTFAEKIIDRIPNDHVQILSMDSYYLHEQPQNNILDSGRANFDHPQAFDWELLRNHISLLKEGQSIDCPIYDFKTSSRTGEATTIDPCAVILFEGIFTLFDHEIRNMLDIKCFLHVEADIRFIRRLNRDVQERGRSIESVTDQYYETVRPMYNKYLDPQRQFADIVVGEETDIAASILSAKIEKLVHRKLNNAHVETQEQAQQL